MQAPRCKICGGWLECRKNSSFWICMACGSEYEYKQSPPTNEMLLLQRMRGELEGCANQVLNASRQFESIMSQLGSFISELPSVPQSICEIGEFAHQYENGCKLQQDALGHSVDIIETLENWCTPIGGGRFELISFKN